MAVAQQQASFPTPATRPQRERGAAVLATWRRKVLRAVLYVVISIIFLVPFIWMFFGSLRDESEIFQYLSPLSWQTFFPIHWTLDHYQTVLGLNEEGKRYGLNFGRNLLNSFIVSAGVVVSSLVFNTMGAYFFARLNFPKKNWLLLSSW